MSRLLILGAGGHGKVIADIAVMTGKWDHIAFLDDREDLAEAVGIPVVGKLEDYEKFKGTFGHGFVAIGNNRVRIEWLNKLASAGYDIPVLVHPASVVSQLSTIRDGSVVMPGAVVNACANIGKGCIINTSSSVDHDCLITNGVHISPGAHVGGTAIIGECTWVCIGVSVANNVRVGSNSIIGAGAAVVTDIPDSVMSAGVPARTIKILE